jgi:small subunit ribosomal protein S2
MKDISLEQLLEAGSHFGHQKRRWNPKMQEYVYGERDGVHIFDLVKTRDGLTQACDYVRKVVSEGGDILFVGTKRQASEIVKSEAERVGMPYVSVRWMGGLLTNFGQLSKSMKKMADLKSKKATGELMKYTKKERLLMDREVASLEKFFGGVTNLTGLPKAIFIVDTHKEEVAVAEAAKTGVTVVGMVDSNADPDKVDYVIPANDDAVKSIELVVEAIAEAVEEGKKAKAETAKKAAEAEESKTEVKPEPEAKVVEQTEEKKAETKDKPVKKTKTKAKDES